MKLKKINQEVLYSGEKIVKLKLEDIAVFKKRASRNRRKRIRLCAHKNVTDRQHEMLIVHKRGAYVRPHKHINKSESLHVIEGKAYLVFFTPKGGIKEVVRIGEYRNRNIFYCRIPKGLYHTLVIISDWIVFHEATKGPFKKSDTVFSPWSPQETNVEACKEYIKKRLSNLKACVS